MTYAAPTVSLSVPADWLRGVTIPAMREYATAHGFVEHGENRFYYLYDLLLDRPGGNAWFALQIYKFEDDWYFPREVIESVRTFARWEGRSEYHVLMDLRRIAGLEAI